MELDRSSEEPAGRGGIADADDNRDEDIVVETPTLRAGELHVRATSLQAHLGVKAQLANLLTLQIGPDVDLRDVELVLNEVETHGGLKVRLHEVYRVLDRALSTIDAHPEILHHIAHPSSSTMRRLIETTSRGLSRALATPRLALRRTRELTAQLWGEHRSH